MTPIESGSAEHHTSLYTRRQLRGSKNIYSVDAAIKNALNVGFPKEKINMGLALFGKSFRLAKSNQNKLGSPISKLGSPGNVLKNKFNK